MASAPGDNFTKRASDSIEEANKAARKSKKEDVNTHLVKLSAKAETSFAVYEKLSALARSLLPSLRGSAAANVASRLKILNASAARKAASSVASLSASARAAPALSAFARAAPALSAFARAAPARAAPALSAAARAAPAPALSAARGSVRAAPAPALSAARGSVTAVAGAGAPPPPAPARAASAAPAVALLENYSKKLAFSEWIHDWWNGFRNKVGGQEVNQIILEALYIELKIPKARWISFRDADYESIDAKNRSISAETSECMTKIYENSKIVVSSVEETTIAAFEDKVEYLSRPCTDAIITYADLFVAANIGPGAEGPVNIAAVNAKILDLRNQFRAITLDPGDKSVKALSAAEKDIIKHAIKLFMTGKENTDEQGAFFLTFDAAGKDITKIFLKDENTYGLIMPANIADSATSSIKKIGAHDNVYFFPDDATSKRNTLTLPEYSIKFSNTGFSPLTPFAFDYVITRGGDEISRSSFGKKITQGPSLDTLMQNHLDAYHDRDFRNSGSSGCLDIAANFDVAILRTVCADVKIGKSIFQSAKMCGDGDQVDEAELAEELFKGTIIFVSADRQAVLERRLRKKAAILHYGGTFTLFRTDEGLDPETIAAYNAAKAAKFVAYNFDLFTKLYDTTENGINAKLFSFKQNFPTAVAIGAHTQSIVEELYNKRRLDIYNYLDKIAEILIHLTAIPELVDGDDIANQNAIKKIFGEFEQANIPITTLIYLDKYQPPAAAGGAGAIKNYNFPFLNFSLEDYINLNSQFRAAYVLMNNPRDVRIPEDFFSHLTQKEGYVDTINTIAESFIDKSIASATFDSLALPASDAIKADQKIVTDFIDEDIEFGIESAKSIAYKARKKGDLYAHRELAKTASQRLRVILQRYFRELVPGDLRGGYRNQVGGVMPAGCHVKEDCDSYNKIVDILKEASLFFNQKNINLNNDIITNENDRGYVTVTSVNIPEETPEKKPFVELVNSISPSDAATVAGNLLIRLNELPEDPTINFIKLLLNPFNEDGKYINKNHPLAKYTDYGYAIKKSAEGPSDYVMGGTEERGVIPRLRSLGEYVVYYDAFNDIADEKPPASAKTYRQLISEDRYSEYFKAAYYVQIDGLICLALLNDWAEGNLKKNKSLFWNYIKGTRPIGEALDIFTKWDTIPTVLTNIFTAVIYGYLSRETIKLAGGSRKTIKRGRSTRRQHKRVQGTHKRLARKKRRTIRK